MSHGCLSNFALMLSCVIWKHWWIGRELDNEIIPSKIKVGWTLNRYTTADVRIMTIRITLVFPRFPALRFRAHFYRKAKPRIVWIRANTCGYPIVCGRKLLGKNEVIIFLSLQNIPNPCFRLAIYLSIIDIGSSKNDYPLYCFLNIDAIFFLLLCCNPDIDMTWF